MPVEQRYIGPLFRASLRYARSLTGDGNIFCLSVKFGLLSLAQKVGPGDSTLDQLPAAARARWGERVAAEMRDRFGTGARAVVVLAGKLYADALEAAKGSAAWRFEEPMRGMGIYDRSSFLHQHAGAQ